MNKEQKKKVTRAFALMQVADENLERATTLLAEFNMDVPDINAEALKLMADATNSIEKSNRFIRSFVRMSVLQQVVEDEERNNC